MMIEQPAKYVRCLHSMCLFREVLEYFEVGNSYVQREQANLPAPQDTKSEQNVKLGAWPRVVASPVAALSRAFLWPEKKLTDEFTRCRWMVHRVAQS